MSISTNSKKMIHGVFDDDDTLMHSVKELRKASIDILEVYTPFPVHGLDKAMGLKPTRIAIAAFMYGIVGLSVASSMMWYIMIHDWPQDIGGKPSFSFIENVPAFIPIMFELTVFFAAHFMVLTYLFRNKLYPGAPAGNPDPRTTDDKFLIEIEYDDNSEKVKELLNSTGAVEINIKEY